MELLIDIYKKLKNHEIRVIRNYLKSSSFDFKVLHKFFDLITRYKDKDESFFSQQLYQNEPDNAFRVSKSRLKRMMEDAILSDKSLNIYKAPYINASLQCKKKLLQGEILLGRGVYAASKNLLHQVTSQAKKYSLHEELFQSELLLHRNQSINMTVKEFQKSSKNLLDLNRINFLINEAAILHYSITNIISNKTLFEKKRIESLREKVARIKEIKDLTLSPVGDYYYLVTQIIFCQYIRDFHQAMKFSLTYLELLENEPAVSSAQRIASAKFQMSEIFMHQRDYTQAQKYVNETLSFFSKEETNYLLVLSSAFRIAFYAEEFEHAHEIIEEALKHPRFEASKMRAAVWHYFHACLSFKEKDFQTATQSLNQATALLADKMGYNVSFRLLEIMILSEVGHEDLVDAKILNMRQFIKRTDKNSSQHRPMILISMLMEWQKNSLNFKKASPALQKKLEQLATYHSNIPFDSTSSELIRLEDWIREKL